MPRLVLLLTLLALAFTISSTTQQTLPVQHLCGPFKPSPAKKVAHDMIVDMDGAVMEASDDLDQGSMHVSLPAVPGGPQQAVDARADEKHAFAADLMETKPSEVTDRRRGVIRKELLDVIRCNPRHAKVSLVASHNP